jgi:hypothetical protein
MDAESAVAMWEEANCNLSQQQTILRHLAFHFGWRLTVPEQRLRELEEGTLLPTTDSVDIKGKKIFFWHKDLQDVTLHRLKLDIFLRNSILLMLLLVGIMGQGNIEW